MNLFLENRPDRKYVQALNKCRLPENEGLIQLFKHKLDETKASLVTADEEHLIRRLQGRARVLQDFLEAVEESSSILERLK